MADPVLVECSEGTWNKVLSGSVVLSVRQPVGAGAFSFVWTSRDTGEAAPSDSDKTDGGLAVPLFEDGRNESIESAPSQDWYIWVENADSDELDSVNIRIDNGGIDNNTLSFSKNGHVITSYSEDYISKGMAFQVHRIFTVPGSGSIDLVVDFSTVSDKLIFTLPIGMGTNEGQVYVNTYNVESYTGGTAIQGINRNTKFLNVAESLFKSGVTATATTENLREYIIGTLSTRQNSGGGTGSGDSPKIFDDEKLIIKVINKESFSVDFEINLNWYEVPFDE